MGGITLSDKQRAGCSMLGVRRGPWVNEGLCGAAWAQLGKLLFQERAA
jgi:hypothetical protein